MRSDQEIKAGAGAAARLSLGVGEQPEGPLGGAGKGASLELVLRCELKLTHRSRSADTAESGRGERHIRIVPVRVVEGVERFEANRQLMVFIEGHRERFVE